MLKPINGTTQLILTKNVSASKPRVDATILFDEFAFVLDNDQYHDMILLTTTFRSLIQLRKFRHFRPSSTHTPTSHPKEWWNYAIKAVHEEIHERCRVWTWDHFKQRRQERVAYLRLWAQHLGQGAAAQAQTTTLAGTSSVAISPDSVELKKLECKLSAEDILFYRTLAEAAYRRNLLSSKQQQSGQNATSNSWWGSLWSSGSGASEAPSQEQIKKFYETIDYDETRVLQDIHLPADVCDVLYPIMP